MTGKMTGSKLLFSELYVELCSGCYTKLLEEMKMNFRVSFYLRSNYKNKEGKSPVMLRIFLNGEMLNLGSTKIFVDKVQWNNKTSRQKGRSSEALTVNASLDSISTTLYEIYKKNESNACLSLEKIKAIYLGTDKEFTSFLPLFDKYLEELALQIGKTVCEATYKKYGVVRKYFIDFLKLKYNKSDLGLNEFTPSVILDFEVYLLTTMDNSRNTANKKLKTLKTVTRYAEKRGFLPIDPFLNKRFQSTPVDRGFLTDEEILTIANKEFDIPRLDLVRDIFLFSCFTGLAYIDVANLTADNLVVLDDKVWLMTKRQKTSIETNVLLLDIPKAIIEKYNHKTYRDGKLFLIFSNQRMNSYLKEIADVCYIKKRLTYHLARHTFATMSLSKGVPMESVSKMLGHTNIKTTQIYARITNKKIEQDMEQLAQKLGKFDSIMTR